MESKAIIDKAHDILRSQRQQLDCIFSPNNVAVVGATDREGSVGRTILWNLLSNPFGGAIFPINPKRKSVLGIPAYTSLMEVPDPIDLAVIVIPAPMVPAVMRDCVAKGVKGAIIISAGFREIGPAGIALEKEILEITRGKIRIIGPNCLGVMNPHSGLNATFASTMARPGNLGFISQSGAFCTSVLDWSLQENVGFSSFISIGSMMDVNWGDLIYYLGDDPNTKSIVMYMESIGNASSFLSAAREVALTKPIIVIKAGQTEQAAQAAASHTGALTGSDDVLNAAFRRCGVLRVTRISELFDMAEVLSKQPRLPKGPNLTIITNAGGPGVIATDALIATGGELANLSDSTVEQLNTFLPTHWSHHNPIDILGDAEPERFAKTLDVAVKDPNSDALLVILTPQAMTDPTETAEKLKQYAQNAEKPVLASWMGGEEVTAGEQVLNEASIPTYRYPDAAARLFNFMWKYNYNLQGLYQTPILATEDDDSFDRALVAKIINQVRAEKRTILTEVESKQILAAYQIPIVQTIMAKTEDEAVQYAEQLGYPVVLKLFSETITHKTDVGGVELNLKNAEAVRVAYHHIYDAVTTKVGSEHFLGVTVQPMLSLDRGYELIIGSSIDPQFGPVLLFGLGGQLVEVFKDRAIALPPLNTTLARRMMEQTKIYLALKGVRGRKSVDLEALEKLIVRFSQLVVEQPWIKEIDINPLLASSERLIALDGRVVLHDPDSNPEDLPTSAIRPYPHHYSQQWITKNNLPVTIRPIRPEDELLMIKLHENLSEESVYMRYFNPMKLSRRTTHERLQRVCFIDYDREMTLVADYENPATGEHEILGTASLSKLHEVNEAEFAVLIIDRHQDQGLGTELLTRLIDIARKEGLDAINGETLQENTMMQRVCEKVGFRLDHAGELVKLTLPLK
jgi:acetyltransferase